MSSKTLLSLRKVPRRRWRIAFLLGLGVLVNYFDRINLSVSHAALITTFAISNVTYGYLSAAYNWTYGFCQIPIGVLLDKYGIRRIGCIGTFLFGVASFGAAVTPSLGGFFAARFLLGIGEAPTFPANAKAIGYWFPPEERSSPTAIFDAGTKFASAIGVPLLGMLLLAVGWRWTFAATGLVSLLYLLLYYRIYRDPVDDPGLSAIEREFITKGRTQAGSDSNSHPPVERASFSDLLHQRKVIGLALGAGSASYVFYLLLTWLPSYLHSALHIDLEHSFLYTCVPWLIATVCDLAIGGWLVDKLIRVGWDAGRVRQFTLIGGTSLGLAILGVPYARSATEALVWISISMSGLSAASPVSWSSPSLIAPRASVGTLSGILNFSNQVSGIAAPIVTGYLVTARHSYGWAFGVCVVYLLIGIASYIFLLGRVEPLNATARMTTMGTAAHKTF